MCRILRDRKPKCFIAENVKGLLTANKHEAFPLILKEFEDSGYDVKYSVLNASEYGVPQKRERVIIVGFRKDLRVDFHFPFPPCVMDNEKVPLQNCVKCRTYPEPPEVPLPHHQPTLVSQCSG